MRSSSSTVLPDAFRSSEEVLPALPIWSFMLGVFALLTFGLTSLPAIICGHLSLAETRKTNHGNLARRVALAGIVIGYAGVAVLGTWLLVAIRFLSAP